MKALILLLAVCTALPAQWLNYPSKGVPKKADGTADLSAPAPRTADGKPDLSGIWQMEPNRPCAAIGCDVPISQEFVNIGYSLKNGLPYQPWAAALVKSRRADFAKDDPGTHCRPLGAVKLHTAPFMRKLVQTPDLLMLVSERDVTYRQIFLDGRPLPVDPTPTWNGYSTGHWESGAPGREDTLVVETNGLHNDTWLDSGGSPLTEGAKMTEKFRRVNFGRLEIEITIDDPKAYTKPWTITLHQDIVLNTDLLDYFCTENERDTPHLIGK